MARVPWDFEPILLALRHTGTRPSNLCRVAAQNLDEEAGVWVFDEHNTDPGSTVHKTYQKTGKALVASLTPALLELCKALAHKHPSGPLSRARRGNPWTPNTTEKHFRLWRKKLAAEGHPLPVKENAARWRACAASPFLLGQGAPSLIPRPHPL